MNVGRLTLVLVLLVGSAIDADAAPKSDEALILVTFPNRSVSPVRTVGRPYRLRARYRVSRRARHAARSLENDYAIAAVDDWPIRSLGVYCVVYRVAGPVSVEDVLERLTGDVRVETAQAMKTFRTLMRDGERYNDTYVQLQHGFDAMGVRQAHAHAVGNGIRIAIVDTGVDTDHEDLAPVDIALRQFVRSHPASASIEHGTAVASIIAASPNNGIGIAGVSPGAAVSALSACTTPDDAGVAECSTFSLAKALDHALDSPPDILNLSIAGPHDPLFGRLVEKIIESGTVVVAALPGGVDAEHVFPAAFPGVIGVSSATERRLTKHLAAPGERIIVALPDDQYDFRSGSSLAAANLSGVVALLLELSPGLTSDRILSVLRQSQRPDPSGQITVNACRALAGLGIDSQCQ